MESHSSTRLVVIAALCSLVLLVTSTQAGAQPPPAPAETNDTRLQVSVHGLVGVALGDFADNVDTTGGVNVDFTYALSGSSFRIGGGVGVLLYDRGTRTEPLSLTVPDIVVDVTTSNDLVSPYFLVRFQPQDGRVRPYAQGRLGFNYLATRTSASGEDADTDFAQTTHFDDFGLAAGVGVGFMADLHEWADGRLGLDIGAEYVYGAPLRYLVPGVLGAAEGVFSFEQRLSRTDLFTLRVGGFVEF
jgi:hypothetical protein